MFLNKINIYFPFFRATKLIAGYNRSAVAGSSIRNVEPKIATCIWNLNTFCTQTASKL